MLQCLANEINRYENFHDWMCLSKSEAEIQHVSELLRYEHVFNDYVIKR